jgi:hypothetical protein
MKRFFLKQSLAWQKLKIFFYKTWSLDIIYKIVDYAVILGLYRIPFLAKIRGWPPTIITVTVANVIKLLFVKNRLEIGGFD